MFALLKSYFIYARMPHYAISDNYKAQGMYSLIAFATQWGSKLGGINSFNTDFLKAFGIAYSLLDADSGATLGIPVAGLSK